MRLRGVGGQGRPGDGIRRVLPGAEPMDARTQTPRRPALRDWADRGLGRRSGLAQPRAAWTTLARAQQARANEAGGKGPAAA